MSIGGKPAGRVVMELRADVVPKTAEVSYIHSLDSIRGRVETAALVYFQLLHICFLRTLEMQFVSLVSVHINLTQLSLSLQTTTELSSALHW